MGAALLKHLADYSIKYSYSEKYTNLEIVKMEFTLINLPVAQRIYIGLRFDVKNCTTTLQELLDEGLDVEE